MADVPEVYGTGAGGIDRPATPRPAPPPPARRRSAAEIRADIEREREQLGRSVEALRGRVTELTDWKRQIRTHRKQVITGAAIVGFAVGGLIALRRR